jgi:hypothetical protein
VHIELALGDPELEGRVEEILPPGRKPSAWAPSAGRFGLWNAGEDSYEVTFEGAPVIEHATLSVALTMLDTQIRLYIGANAREWTFVHAGVVALDGRALVLPGESFVGKTTLVRALVDRGAKYYSDEYAVLDEVGMVHPYPRRLSLRWGDGSIGRHRLVPEPGAVAGDERAALAAVAVTRYRPGFDWKPKRVSRGQGIVALLANTVPAQERPEQSPQTLRRAMASATTFEGDRGEAGPVASALLDELAALAR